MTKATIFGMNCREITIFLASHYQSKKKRLSAYGDNAISLLKRIPKP